jgi:radical SAM protein with 4Fe4S-binding SPASM domain
MEELLHGPGADCLAGEKDDLSRYLAKAAESRIPLAVSFELTRRCSFRCVHCYLGDQSAIHTHQDQELDTEAVLRLLNELAEAGTLFLTLTGGDPMLRPDFVKIYEHAVCIGLLVSVYCNGSLVTDAILESFARYPPRIVEVTIYGATEETFEAISQKPGSFAACMEGIAGFRRTGARLRLKTVVMTLNHEELPVLRQMADDMGLQFRHDCSIIPALANADNGARSNIRESEKGDLKAPLRFRLSPELSAEADFSSKKVKAKLEQGLARKTPVSGQAGALHHCGAGRSSCHITPYGRVQSCIISLLPYADITGKVYFQDAWDTVSGQFSGQKAQDHFLCIGCRDKTICTGCPSAFLLETGSTQEPASFYCKYAACRKKQALI